MEYFEILVPDDVVLLNYSLCSMSVLARNMGEGPLFTKETVIKSLSGRNYFRIGKYYAKDGIKTSELEMRSGYLEPISGTLFSDGIERIENLIPKTDMLPVCYKVTEQDYDSLKLYVPKGRVEGIDVDLVVENKAEYFQDGDWVFMNKPSLGIFARDLLIYHRVEGMEGIFAVDPMIYGITAKELPTEHRDLVRVEYALDAPK